MASISTNGHAGSRARPSPWQKRSDQAFTVTFLITSAVATIGWLYVLALGALALTSWLLP